MMSRRPRAGCRRPGYRPIPTGDADLRGWVKIWRIIRAHRLWELPPAHFKVAITLLLVVNRRAASIWNGREGIEIRPGEVLTSQDQLAERAGGGITRRIVRRALVNLSRVGFLSVRRSTVSRVDQLDTRSSKSVRIWAGRGIIVTITNWERYQANGDETEPDAVRSRSLRGPFAVHKQEVGEGGEDRNPLGMPDRNGVRTPAVLPRVLAAFIEEFDREPIDGERMILPDFNGFPDEAIRTVFRETKEKGRDLTFARAVLRYSASAAATGSSQGGRT